jgi:hypothetical protein
MTLSKPYEAKKPSSFICFSFVSGASSKDKFLFDKMDKFKCFKVFCIMSIAFHLCQNIKHLYMIVILGPSQYSPTVAIKGNS